MTTGAAATSRCARKYTAAATRNNITPTKNIKRPSRRRSRRESADDDDGCWCPGTVVAHHYREASFDVGYYAPYQVRLDSGGLIYVVDPAEQIRAVAQSDP